MSQPTHSQNLLKQLLQANPNAWKAPRTATQKANTREAKKDLGIMTGFLQRQQTYNRRRRRFIKENGPTKKPTDSQELRAMRANLDLLHLHIKTNLWNPPKRR